MSEKLAKLAALADMIKEAELSRLSAAETARRAISRKSAAVRTAVSDANRNAEPDAAHASGTAARWHTWADRRLKALTLQEATAAAEAEVQKRAASRAFGRAAALGRLAQRSNKDRKGPA